MDSPLLIHPSTAIEIEEQSETGLGDAGAQPKAAALAPNLTGQILVRLAVVLAVVGACIAGNRAACNSFDVSVVGDYYANTLAYRRFDLMFVSNGKIANILYSANKVIEQVLYPTGSYPKKPLNRVTIRLSGQNFTGLVGVGTGLKPGEFSITLSPNFLSSENPAAALQTMLHRAMARVRVHNGPEEVVNAIVDYLAMHATPETNMIADSTQSANSCWSVESLKFFESRENGFVARLNRRLGDGSSLGLLNQSVCDAYKSSLTT